MPERLTRSVRAVIFDTREPINLCTRRQLSRRHLLNFSRCAIWLARLRGIQGTIACLSIQAILPRGCPILRGLQSCSYECLLEVVDDVLDMLKTQRDTNKIRCYATFDLLGVWDLLMSSPPWVDDERLRVSDIRQMGAKLEIVNDGCDFCYVARHTLVKR